MTGLDAASEAWVRRQVDAAPPITDAQRDTLTRIFRNAYLSTLPERP